MDTARSGDANGKVRAHVDVGKDLRVFLLDRRLGLAGVSAPGKDGMAVRERRAVILARADLRDEPADRVLAALKVSEFDHTHNWCPYASVTFEAEPELTGIVGAT